MKFLNREKAPISQTMWDTIDDTMLELLAKRLKMRSVIDFNETNDFTTDAVATGRLKQLNGKKGTTLSVRQPILMTEVRHDFSISKANLEDMKRDIEDMDDSELRAAANAFAEAENSLILDGVKEAGSKGLLASLEQKQLKAKGAKELMVAVAKSQEMFDDEFVDGEFKLVVSSATFSQLVVESEGGVTMKRKIENILGEGSIIVSKAMGDDKALIISQRGGDFVFYSGLDVQVGFESEEKDKLNFFMIESCAYRTIAPEAAIVVSLS